MRINTNLTALTAMRHAGTASTQLGKSVERLASGLRINRAADDAAGLSLSEKVRAQIRGSIQAIRNGQDAISMIQTAEGALSEVHERLQRMRELGVQFANDTLASDSRLAIISELNQLDAEINALAERTKFNGQYLLKGALDAAATVSVGVRTDSGLQRGAFDPNLLVTNISFTAANDGTDIEDTYFFSYAAAGGLLRLTRQSDGASATYDTGLSTLTGPGDSEAFTFDFASGADVTIGVSALAGFTAAGSDLAALLANAGSSLRTVLTSGDRYAYYHVGANADEVFKVGFDEVTSSTLGYTLAPLDPILGVTAEAFIFQLDADIESVSAIRAKLGAAQNRLEAGMSINAVAAENSSAAESRIRDADMAAATVDLARAQILQRSGIAVLGQANVSARTVLRLLA